MCYKHTLSRRSEENGVCAQGSASSSDDKWFLCVLQAQQMYAAQLGAALPPGVLYGQGAHAFSLQQQAGMAMGAALQPGLAPLQPGPAPLQPGMALLPPGAGLGAGRAQ